MKRVSSTCQARNPRFHIASEVHSTHFNSVLGLFPKYFNSSSRDFSAMHRHVMLWSCLNLVCCSSARSGSTQEYSYSNENSNRAGQLKRDKHLSTKLNFIKICSKLIKITLHGQVGSAMNFYQTWVVAGLRTKGYIRNPLNRFTSLNKTRKHMQGKIYQIRTSKIN